MKYVEKTKTWSDNWNDIIRIMYKDEEQKSLMLVPQSASIMQFIEKYMIEDSNSDEIITDEHVRVIHYDTEGSRMDNKNVKVKYKEFDIYVNKDVEHTASNDRLKSRSHMIANRIKYILLHNYHICNMHFNYEDEYNLWTKLVGYKRYHIAFSYITTV